MKLTLLVKLAPTPEQHQALLKEDPEPVPVDAEDPGAEDIPAEAPIPYERDPLHPSAKGCKPSR